MNLPPFPEFLEEWVTLRDGGGRRFTPWPWQRELAAEWQAHPRMVVLKARQLGISWMAAALALWTALSRPGSLVLLVSQTKADAQELLAKVRFLWEHLPEPLRRQAGGVGRDSSLVLEFPELSSAVEALPSTRKAGRGRTARLVIADEHAFHPWPAENFAALAPTVEAGGQFLSISTANGAGGFFAELWRRAGEPDSGWRRVFLPYHLHPQRDEAWYARKREEYTRLWMLHQEFPRDAEEAFVQTGRPCFGREYLEAHRRLCRPPLPRAAWPEALRALRGLGCPPEAEALRVFALPLPGHRYVAGADVAEGLEHGDACDLVVLDLDAREPGGQPGRAVPAEVLSLHGRWPPDEYAVLIDGVARVYPGLTAVERNNHGLAVLLALRRLGTPGLFRERPVLDRQGREVAPGRLGWLTTSATKPLMIDELEEALRRFELRLSDEQALSELLFYQVGRDGATGAPPGQCDDRVISRAIAWQMRKYRPPRLPSPREQPPITFAPRSW